MSLIPNKTQWKKWALPSKLTTIGTLVGVISLLLGVISFFYMIFQDPSTNNEFSIEGSSNTIIHNGEGNLNNIVNNNITVDLNDFLSELKEIIELNKSITKPDRILELSTSIETGDIQRTERLLIEHGNYYKNVLNVPDDQFRETKNAIIQELIDTHKNEGVINQKDKARELEFRGDWLQFYKNIIEKIDVLIGEYKTQNPKSNINKDLLNTEFADSGIIGTIAINDNIINICHIKPEFQLGEMKQASRLQFLLNDEEQFAVNIYENKGVLVHEIQTATPLFQDYAMTRKGKISSEFHTNLNEAIKKILQLTLL